MHAAGGRVDWREWGEPAFGEARETDRPLLLSLVRPWCGDCREMDEETYADPDLADAIEEGFVPVRVDVDRNPRAGDRYAMGGFPSTVFATPDGGVLAGATYIGPEGMRQVLERIEARWREEGAAAGRVPRALRDPEPPGGELTPAVESTILEGLREAFDVDHGGWGSAPKFPLPRTIEFALERDGEQARRTLEAIRRHLYDDYEGGFYRYASGADWSGLAREKPLDVNAGLLRAFANAYRSTGEDAYREPADRTVEHLTTTLWTGEAFAASQAPGAEGASEREGDPPPVDETVLADRNALAIEALLTHHARTGDEHARRFAERALDHLIGEFVDGGAVRHCAGGERGLLVDQARTLAALSTARQVLGDEDALDRAVAVAEYTLETLRVGPTFVDGPREGPGLLEQPLRPLDQVAEAADALVDLSVLTGDDRYRGIAREALGAFAGASDRIGAEHAHYGTAVARTLSPSSIRLGTPPNSDLHRTALRVADHETVVVPDADVGAGTARVAVDDRTRTVRTPGELERVVGR